MTISFIVAMDKNRVIGYRNTLPWRLPADLAYVKKITSGHHILMGRKTYESIGKPLPGRTNIVFTRNPLYKPEGCHVVHSVEEALRKYAGAELFIFGGAEIYKLFLPVAERMYVTEIAHEFPGDTYFPETDPDDWREISRIRGVRDEKNPYEYYFVVYERTKKPENAGNTESFRDTASSGSAESSQDTASSRGYGSFRDPVSSGDPEVSRDPVSSGDTEVSGIQ